MVLLTNQFHDSFERLSLTGHKKYICAQSETIIFLCDGVQLQTRLFACTCLAPVGELFSRRVFSFQWKMHQLKKSDCGLIEAKFVNIATCCLSMEFLGFLGSIFTENSPHSSPTLAVQQTVEFACELFCIRRPRNQRDRFWPPIGHKHIFCAQSETSIRMSRGTGSLRKLRAWIISMGQVKSPARFFSWKGLHCSFNFFFSTKADRRF